MNFEDRRTTKKGSIGEELVKKHLINQGYAVAQFESNGPHCIDFVVHKIGDKTNWFCADVKTKEIKQPWKTTGFEKRTFDEYLLILEKYKTDVFIYFVDAAEGCCYGEWISILKDNIKRVIKHQNSDIVMFERELLRVQFDLTREDMIKINKT